MTSRRAAPPIMTLLTLVWALGATAMAVYAGLDVARGAGRNAGRSADQIRSGRLGERWALYQALAALPPDALIVIPGGPDEIRYYARYYAYPRPVLRGAIADSSSPRLPADAHDRAYLVLFTSPELESWTIRPVARANADSVGSDR